MPGLRWVRSERRAVMAFGKTDGRAHDTGALRFHGGMVVAVYFAAAPGRVRAAVWEMRVRLPLPPRLGQPFKRL